VLSKSSTYADIGIWLAANDLGVHKRAFAEHKIDGRSFFGVTDTDLKEMGVTAIGDRRIITEFIKQQTTSVVGTAVCLSVCLRLFSAF
jgi:hypothetical protein